MNYMNKFTEQNKAIDKDAQHAKTSKDHSPAAAANSPACKTSTSDKSKPEVHSSHQSEKQPKDAFNGKWKDHIHAAKSNWSKISETELTKSNGIEKNLCELVQKHYLLTHEESSKQVKSFITKCKC